MAALKRQFINDETGKPIAIILPFEEYIIVKDVLESHKDAEKLALMEQTTKDERYLNDLKNIMTDFRHIDAEWWEQDA